MLIYSVLKFLLGIAGVITGWISSFGSPEISFNWVDEAVSMLDVVFYLVPLHRLEPLILLVLFTSIARIVIAGAKFIFDAIPLW